jgi:hypothetical protein
MASPLLDMLDANVEKYRTVTAKIKKKYADLIPEEKKAFTALKDYWRTSPFDAAKCNELLEQMELGSKKHPGDHELLTNIQEFRSLCKSYYTRDKTLFDAFKQAMTPTKQQQQQPDAKPDAKPNTPNPSNPLLEMLEQNVKSWKTTADEIFKKYLDLIPEEKEAMVQLDEYWNKNNFNAAQCMKLVEMLGLGQKKHPGDYELLTELNEFRRLCRDYYTKDKQIYLAFQKAMGGKGSKTKRILPEPEEVIDDDELDDEDQPIYGNNRIDYPDGAYYIGKYDRNAEMYEEPNGQGKYYFKSGSWEEGFFKNGKLYGEGAKYDSKGKFTLRGTFHHGERIGIGTVLFSNGDQYEGQWSQDGINGKGRYTYSSGGWEEGFFVDGKLRGPGKQYNAQSYITDTGNFVDGQLSGHAVSVWENTGQRFEGEMTDSMNGEGILYRANGTKERVRMVNGNFVYLDNNGGGSGNSGGGKKRRTYTRSGLGTGIGSTIASWVWDHLAYLPWAILFIATLSSLITTWIAKGFLSGLLEALYVGLIGGVIATIFYFCITFIQMALEAVYDFFIQLPRWLNLTLLVLVIGVVAYWLFGSTVSGWFGGGGGTSAKGAAAPPANLIGTWNGTLNNNHVQLKFTGVNDGKVSAEIYFPNGNVEQLEGSADGNRIYLKDQTINSHYDGEYSGTISGTAFNGKYKNPKSGAELNFKFEREE